jgi:hypothetical protein
VLVRTRDARTWLLIKHRDEWAGDLDITEFAPLSVKSKGDFEDILAEDTPAVWLSNRPAKGGEAGAMLATIIDRAAKLKAKRLTTKDTKDTKITKDTKNRAPTGRTTRRSQRSQRKR